jgi:enoyl-CoA hydratase/carnithine racemase
MSHILRPPWQRDSTTGYGTLATTSLHGGAVLRVGINNPPLNLYDYKLNQDMIDFLLALEKVGTSNHPFPVPKVVIFYSELPDFFVWWLDVNGFVPGRSKFSEEENATLFDNSVKAMRLLRELPTIFIAEVNGRASGSGNEMVVQCDMSFAGPNAILSNPETALGGMAVNGGASYLVRALGIQRAGEYLYGCVPIRGAEAAQIGWVNRAFSTSEALTAYVDILARRISYNDAAPLRITKTALRAHGPTSEESQAHLESLQQIVPIQTANFVRDVELSGNFTVATPWTLDMFASVESLRQLHPDNETAHRFVIANRFDHFIVADRNLVLARTTCHTRRSRSVYGKQGTSALEWH